MGNVMAACGGDSAAGYQIAQKMGLKYLPVVVRSEPAGAEVWRDGAKLGIAPLILDIPAGERGTLALEARKPVGRERRIAGRRCEVHGRVRPGDESERGF